LIKSSLPKIVQNIKNQGTNVIVELGAGSLRKTTLLLDALESAKIAVTYYALDLMRDELDKSLKKLLNRYQYVTVKGLLGTYDDGMTVIKEWNNKLVMWLGSSIGNYTREEAKLFLKKLRQEALNPDDQILIGFDGRNSSEKINLAYDDPSGLTAEFILNGLNHCNRLLGNQVFDQSKFSYHAFYNESLGRHEAYYRSLVDQRICEKNYSCLLRQGELIHIEYSYKFSDKEMEETLTGSGFNTSETYRLSQEDMKTGLSYGGLWIAMPESMLSENNDGISTPTSPRSIATNNSTENKSVPSLQEWESLWHQWDIVIFGIVGKKNVMEQPIGLRHPIIFYLGHLPCFCDVQISRSLSRKIAEPQYFSQM